MTKGIQPIEHPDQISELMKTFYNKLKAQLKKLNAVTGDHKYHPENERNPDGYGWAINESFDLVYKRKEYGIRLCQVTDQQPLQVFVARTEDGEGQGNNYHVSFSSDHFDDYGILHIKPSLIRCRNAQAGIFPKRIGNYPAHVCGTKSRFLIGRIDDDLFPRVFAVVDAKFDLLP